MPGATQATGASPTGYLPDVTPDGQLVIRDSYLGAGFDPAAPWALTATTARTDPGRDLNDPEYHRLFEYHDTGESVVASEEDIA